MALFCYPFFEYILEQIFQSMRLTRVIAFMAIATIAGLFAWRWSATDTAPVQAAQPVVKSSLPEAVNTPPARLPAPEPVRAGDSIEDKVAALPVTGTPEQYLRVFHQVEACLAFEREKTFAVDINPKMVQTPDGERFDLGQVFASPRELDTMRKFCASMSGRTRSDRYQLLQYALDHHAPGALSAYVNGGPKGEPGALDERPGDPDVIEWRASANKRLRDDMDAGYAEAIVLYAAYGAIHGFATPEEHYLATLTSALLQREQNPMLQMNANDALKAASQPLTPQQRADVEIHAKQVILAWKRLHNKF